MFKLLVSEYINYNWQINLKKHGFWGGECAIEMSEEA